MELIKQFVFSFMSTIGFAVLFSSPKKSVVYAGLVGAIGWMFYYITFAMMNSYVASTFFGALTVGLLGELFARKYKKPATLYITAGIIPLVPGAGAYYTMLYLIENEFSLAATKGVETFFIAAAISMGIIISSIFSKSIKRVRQKD
ncbi:MAG: threonine/serine exporter [Tissierellia bacterium]|nr:threonine/serine exporter [Tissierellia bacterium]